MKTALLLTSSADTQRLLTELLGQNTNFVLLPIPTGPTREKFDALFSHWLRFADAVILDAATLGPTSRWAIESLSTAALQPHQAVVIRLSAAQQTLYHIPGHWLITSDTDTPEQLRQALANFFELRETQARLKRADAALARHRQSTAHRPAPPPAPLAAVAPTESYRYRHALKSLSQLLSRRPDEQTLWTEFLGILRELLGVGKLALFARPYQPSLFGDACGLTGSSLGAVATAGIAREVAAHLRLDLGGGIAGYLAREAKVLRRTQVLDPAAPEHDPDGAGREFELLGAELAVPMFDPVEAGLLGVLCAGGKITGEPISNEELELCYHLLSQLAQALRTLQLQRQLADQQRLLSELLANIQTGVIAADQTGTVLAINRRALELMDIAGQQLLGQNLGRLPSRVGDVLFEVLKTGTEVYRREVSLPRSHRPLGVSARRFPVWLGSHQPGQSTMLVVGLIDDLSQAKLEAARARQQADREFFMRLAARLSHELKNSLVSIKIFAQLLPERYNDKEFREQFSATVANEVNRVDVLVNNLTFFAHPLQLVCEELVLSELIQACVSNVSQEFARKKLAHLQTAGDAPAEPAAGLPVVTVKLNLAHKFSRLEADRIRLMQAFEHVLRNAVQSMPRGGRLAVSTSDCEPADFPAAAPPPGGAVKIEFQDTGEGIALEQLKRVTEPFVTTRNVGVGLGLTIVKKIVERHGGRLEIDSLLGRGTTVTIWLPLKAQPHPEDELLEKPSAEQHRPAPQAELERGEPRVRQPLQSGGEPQAEP
jgi:signal transduction histidine kinase